MNRRAGKTEYIKPELTVEELSIALYQVSKKLKASNEELLQSQKELAEVFANISHDLRSPITAIRSSMDYILSLDSFDKEELLAVINLMHRRVDYLEQLINDIFLLSSIDSSHRVFRFESIEIGPFLEDFYYCCEADKKYSKRKLFMNVPEHFPYRVSMDCKMMLRVLDNLFTNALNYSKDGDSITLSASYSENRVIICVSDTGIGIEKENITKIFKRTYMVSSARTPGQGCGLGLSIAKAIIDNHGGKIRCESEFGKGSNFIILLPIAGD